MKIPTYQSHIPYQGATSHTVHMAEPMKEAQRVGPLLQWTQIGQAASIAGQTYTNVQRVIEKIKERRRAKKQGLPSAPDKKAPSTTAEGQSPDQTTPQSSAKEPAYSGFSDPARSSLLAYGRQQMQQVFEIGNGSSKIKPEKTVQEQLDTYVSQHWPAVSNEETQQQLWTQDYVVLRQEMAHLQDQHQQQQRQEQFQTGAGNFIQTAALIRTPHALESYIESNLSAAEKEFLSQEKDPVSWTAQKEFLYEQAISHNIESALQAKEVRQAEQVYQHFAPKLSSAVQEILSEKVNLARADEMARQYVVPAWQECMSESREIDEKKLATFVQEHSEGKENIPVIEKILRGKLQEERRKQFAQQSRQYQELIDQAKSGQIDSLSCMSAHWTTTEAKQNWQLLQRIQINPAETSSPDVFNRLYEQISTGQLSQQEFQQLGQQNQLSAVDCLRLKQYWCVRQLQAADPREHLLLKGVELFCREKTCSEAETQQTKYFVLASGAGYSQRVQAARQVKQLLSLQEK